MRRSFYLTTICGTALALSTPAIAQNARPSDNENRVRTAQPRSATNPEAESILRRLEGLWTVEMRVNEALWNMSTGDRSAWSDRDNRPTTGRDNAPQGQPNSYDAGAKVEPRTLQGAAETSLVMDGKILRERAFINNTMGASGSSDADRRTGATRIEPSGSMSTLSFISFDERNGTYSAVFMSSKDGMMQFDSGRFDASANRIVFEGRQHAPATLGYRAPEGDPAGQLDREFIDDSYPNKPAAPGTSDRDNKSPDRNPDRTEHDGADHDQPADRPATDRPTTDRNTPTPVDSDRTTTDRSTTDRTTQPDKVQPGKVQPAKQGDEPEKPYWENNSPDGRTPGSVQPGDARPANRSNLNPGGDYVVVPSNSAPVRVVLELLGSDQYRVTMYQGPSVEWSDNRPADGVNANPNSRDNTKRPGTNQPDAKGPSTSTLAGNVVYQATFTRATGADATAYRQMFDANNR